MERASALLLGWIVRLHFPFNRGTKMLTALLLCLAVMEASIGTVMDSGTDVARKAFLMRHHIMEFQAAISSIGETSSEVMVRHTKRDAAHMAAGRRGQQLRRGVPHKSPLPRSHSSSNSTLTLSYLRPLSFFRTLRSTRDSSSTQHQLTATHSNSSSQQQLTRAIHSSSNSQQ